jgi:glutathione gamma-glutamylcysteinyltransferase
VESLYRRPLPDRHVAFSSDAGKSLFRAALAEGTLENYFPLAEQHHTQSDPSFCGLGALVVALNALSIDPGRHWKGPWRWFSEELLDCCMSNEQVRQRGVTLDELACLALCNGALVDVVRSETTTESEFRRVVELTSRGTGTVLIAAYDRGSLDQTGSGHFSPLAGYHVESDRVLVLDVARFKYPAHWVRVPELFQSMRSVDPATGRGRGWLSLKPREATSNHRLPFWGGAESALGRQLERTVRDALTKERPQSVDRALSIAALSVGRLLVDGASDSAGTFAQGSFDRLLEPLTAGALFDVVERARGPLPAALLTALLYLLPKSTWEPLGSPLTAEIERLCQGRELAPDMLRDLELWRSRFACGTDTTSCAR